MSQTDILNKAKALKAKYTKKQLIQIAKSNQIKVYTSWPLIRMATALVRGGYSDPGATDEDETESESDNEQNETESEAEAINMDQDAIDNHNSNHNRNHNNNDSNHGSIVMENQEPSLTNAEKINKIGHNIHFDISSETIAKAISYQTFRRVLLKKPSDLEATLSKNLVKYINKNQNEFTLDEKLITATFTAASKPVKPTKYTSIPKNDTQKQANWRNGQTVAIKERTHNYLTQINGAGMLMLYDLDAKAAGLSRKACVTYFGAFDEDNEDVEEARKEVNLQVGKLVDVCIERRRALKENNNKDVLIVRDLRKKLAELKERKEEMDESVCFSFFTKM